MVCKFSDALGKDRGIIFVVCEIEYQPLLKQMLMENIYFSTEQELNQMFDCLKNPSAIERIGD